MPKTRSPILEKVTNLLKISIFISKMGKPITANLIFLKKTKKINLLKHYNYGFVEEYEFSPSTTPLIHYTNYYRNPLNKNNKNQKKKKKRNYRNLCSMLFLCSTCYRGIVDCRPPLEAAAAAALPAIEQVAAGVGELYEAFDSDDEDEDDGDDSVDQRAEMFIERFYHQMRMQRHD